MAISDPYLPPSSSGFSLIQNLGAAWAGNYSDETDNSYRTTFNGNTIIGFGEKAVRSQWHYSDEQGYQVSNLYWAKDFRGKHYSAGLFQPQGNFGYFNTSRSVFGVEFRNSRLTRTDLSYQEGAQVEINMPVRGRVEVYRENRLVHSELLDAGNRLLDTSGLPGGAYEIEVRTFDESGRLLTSFTEFLLKISICPHRESGIGAYSPGCPQNQAAIAACQIIITKVLYRPIWAAGSLTISRFSVLFLPRKTSNPWNWAHAG